MHELSFSLLPLLPVRGLWRGGGWGGWLNYAYVPPANSLPQRQRKTLKLIICCKQKRFLANLIMKYVASIHFLSLIPTWSCFQNGRRGFFLTQPLIIPLDATIIRTHVESLTYAMILITVYHYFWVDSSWLNLCTVDNGLFMRGENWALTPLKSQMHGWTAIMPCQEIVGLFSSSLFLSSGPIFFPLPLSSFVYIDGHARDCWKGCENMRKGGFFPAWPDFCVWIQLA